MVSPRLKKRAAEILVKEQQLSRRRACKVVKLNRSSFAYKYKSPEDKEKQLMKEILKLSEENPRYGYRRITCLLRRAGWNISYKKVQRLRRSAGMRVSARKAKRKRQGDSTGLPSKALFINHVWTWDFVSIVTESGRTIRIMTLVDEYTRRFLGFKVGYSLRHQDVIHTLRQAIQKHGIPQHIRSDNGPEFIAGKLKAWLWNSSIKTIYIDPGCPWQNPYIESFHSRFRDECLDREIFINLTEAQVIVEDFQEHYNNRRPHSSLNYLTPMEFFNLKEKKDLLACA